MSRRPLVIGVVVAAVLGAAFLQLAAIYESTAVIAFDAAVSGAIQELRTPWLTPVMRFVTFMGDTPAVTVMTLAAMTILWTRGHRRRAWYVGIVGAVGALLSTFFKIRLGRPRPPIDTALVALPLSFSFPSGHTMASLCLGWAIAYVTVRSRQPRSVQVIVCVLAAGYALSVAFSRVYLGVHWPSDVLASWLLGGAWCALATGVYEWRRISAREAAGG